MNVELPESFLQMVADRTRTDAEKRSNGRHPTAVEQLENDLLLSLRQRFRHGIPRLSHAPR